MGSRMHNINPIEKYIVFFNDNSGYGLGIFISVLKYSL